MACNEVMVWLAAMCMHALSMRALVSPTNKLHAPPAPCLQKKKRVKGRDGKKGGKPTFVVENIPCESFFNFFDPPQVCMSGHACACVCAFLRAQPSRSKLELQQNPTSSNSMAHHCLV